MKDEEINQKKNDDNISKERTNAKTKELNYININHKNIVELIDGETQKKEMMQLINDLSMGEDDFVGGGINKFFNLILPENKENELLKINTSIANKKKLDNNNLIESIDRILNMKENKTLILNSENAENISYLLISIYQKIKKQKKYKKQEEIENNLNIIRLNGQIDILSKYLKKNVKEKLDQKVDYFSGSANRDSEKMLNNNTISYPKSAYKNNYVEAEYDFQLINSEERIYKFFKTKDDDKYPLPLEMLILSRKFQMVKTIKLILNKGNNSDNVGNNGEGLLDKNDLLNNVYIFLNINWLFPYLIEIEIDLTNDNMLKDQSLLGLNDLKTLAQLSKKGINQTNYKTGYYKKRSFNQYYTSNFDNFDYIDYEANDIGSTTFCENLKNQEDLATQEINIFINKYKFTLQMIIIYSYFLSKIKNLSVANFIIPNNYTEEILSMLYINQICIFDFSILSFFNTFNLRNLTMDFNSLDSDTFDKVNTFIFKNSSLGILNLSFFPTEDYYKPENLLKMLRDSDLKYKTLFSEYKNKIKAKKNKMDLFKFESNESIEKFLLRKLTKFFEKNLKSFFYLLATKKTLREINLIFDMPTIIYNNDYYSIIIMKFFLNLFAILNNVGNTIENFSIIAENFNFDNRKYPILNGFLENLDMFKNPKHKTEKFTFQVRFYGLNNIYCLVPYNVIYLSIGTFDFETLNGFVEYITSSDFSLHSNLSTLKVGLGITIISFEKVNDLISRLLTQYPKKLKELNIYTYLEISNDNLLTLLNKTNYNTLEKIFIQVNKKSLKEKELDKSISYQSSNGEVFFKDSQFMDLYFVKRTKKQMNKILNTMMHLSKKFKKPDFMCLDIYLGMEKFFCENEKKINIVLYK